MSDGEEVEIDWTPPGWIDEGRSELPDTLYHYTRSEGLLGIVGSRSLWATEIHYLNDIRELKHTIELARTQIGFIPERIGIEEAPELAESFAEAIDILENDYEVYVFSLSEKADLLSQWRAYCPNGGFSIGFPFKLLRRTLRMQNLVFMRCIYDHEMQQKILVHMIDDIVSKFRRKKSEDPDGTNHVELLAAAQEGFGASLGILASLFKHVGFAEEREWRVTSVPLPAGQGLKPKFRSGMDSILVPYAEVPLRDEIYNELSVIVGPSPRQELSVQSVTTLFRHEGIPVKRISRSATPNLPSLKG